MTATTLVIPIFDLPTIEKLSNQRNEIEQLSAKVEELAQTFHEKCKELNRLNSFDLKQRIDEIEQPAQKVRAAAYHVFRYYNEYFKPLLNNPCPYNDENATTWVTQQGLAYNSLRYALIQFNLSQSLEQALKDK